MTPCSEFPSFGQHGREVLLYLDDTRLCSCVTLTYADRAPTFSFLMQAQRIVAEGYVPSTEDVLRAAEHPAAGITETCVKTGQLSIQICQVHGQQNNRRKWIHLFENVTSIIFCASLSDYDQEVIGEAQQVCIFLLSP